MSNRIDGSTERIIAVALQSKSAHEFFDPRATRGRVRRQAMENKSLRFEVEGDK